MWETFQVNIYIHAIETGYQCRNHQRNGKACHSFHDGIHVVGDNGGKGIHGSREDVAVNIHRVVCLL